MKSGISIILNIEKEEVLKGTKVYTALQKIIDKYQLTAFALRCFDMAVQLKITGCLSLPYSIPRKYQLPARGCRKPSNNDDSESANGYTGLHDKLGTQKPPRVYLCSLHHSADLVDSYSLTTHLKQATTWASMDNYMKAFTQRLEW